MIINKVFKFIWDRAFIELDSLFWRWRTSSLRRIETARQIGTVMFCDLSPMLSVSKIESLFAAALSVRGYSSVFLLRSRSRPIMRLSSSCSNVRFVFLDDYLSDSLWKSARDDISLYFNPAMDFDNSVELEVDGFRVGRNVQSRVVRSFRVGQLDSKNPKHLHAFKETLVESLAVSRASISLLEKFTPDKAIFLEKGYTPSGEFYDACLLQGVDTVQWISAPQNDHFIFKRYSLSNRADHPFSLGDSSWEKICSMPWSIKKQDQTIQKIASHYQNGASYNRQQLQLGKQIFSPELVRRKLRVPPGRKIAVIFAHILYDATFFYGSSLFSNYESWLVETVRCAIANTNLHWLVKVHPVNVWRSQMDGELMEQLEAQVLKREFGDLPDHVTIIPADTDINTFSLFSLIDVGLTVRGTIGMELPCFGVPVVTAGTGRYSGRGFTIDPPDIPAYQRLLSELHLQTHLTADIVSIACRYAYGSFFMRPYPIDSFKINNDSISFGVSALRQNISLDFKHSASAINSGDLADIANFVIDNTREDLLFPL